MVETLHRKGPLQLPSGKAHEGEPAVEVVHRLECTLQRTMRVLSALRCPPPTRGSHVGSWTHVERS